MNVQSTEYVAIILLMMSFSWWYKITEDRTEQVNTKDERLRRVGSRQQCEVDEKEKQTNLRRWWGESASPQPRDGDGRIWQTGYYSNYNSMNMSITVSHFFDIHQQFPKCVQDYLWRRRIKQIVHGLIFIISILESSAGGLWQLWHGQLDWRGGVRGQVPRLHKPAKLQPLLGRGGGGGGGGGGVSQHRGQGWNWWHTGKGRMALPNRI